MAESKMPAKIGVGQHTGWAAVHTAKMKGDTVYIRADLVEPLVEALRRSREAVNAVVLSTHSVSFNADLRAIDAALSSWEALPSGQAQTEPRHDES